MALYAFAAVLICWGGWGYQMSFGTVELTSFVGRPSAALNQGGLLVQPYSASYFPTATMVFFQFVFAAITLILIAGALLGRMNFLAWMLFVPLWLTFSYTVGTYSLWVVVQVWSYRFLWGLCYSSFLWCCWIYCSLLGWP